MLGEKFSSMCDMSCVGAQNNRKLFNLNSSMTPEKTLPVREDHVIQLRAPQQVRRWTLDEDECFVRCCFQGQERMVKGKLQEFYTLNFVSWGVTLHV